MYSSHNLVHSYFSWKKYLTWNSKLSKNSEVVTMSLSLYRITFCFRRNVALGYILIWLIKLYIVTTDTFINCCYHIFILSFFFFKNMEIELKPINTVSQAGMTACWWPIMNSVRIVNVFSLISDLLQLRSWKPIRLDKVNTNRQPTLLYNHEWEISLIFLWRWMVVYGHMAKDTMAHWVICVM